MSKHRYKQRHELNETEKVLQAYTGQEWNWLVENVPDHILAGMYLIAEQLLPYMHLVIKFEAH